MGEEKKEGKILQMNEAKGIKLNRQRINKFNRVQEDVRSMLERAKVNALCYMGIEGGEFSGGTVGDVQIVAEALLVGCKRSAALFYLLDIVVTECKKSGVHNEAVETEEDKAIETSVSKMFTEEKIESKLLKIFEERKIEDIIQMSDFTEEEVKSWKGMNKGMFGRLTFRMYASGVSFKEITE